MWQSLLPNNNNEYSYYTSFSSKSSKIKNKYLFKQKIFNFFNFLIFFKFLFIFPLFYSLTLSIQTLQPRPSCREHLLNGNYQNNKIYPLISPSSIIYWLECRFPPPGPQSGRLSYQTIINNALIGQWINFDKKEELNNQSIYIQQQIDFNFLSNLIKNSDECLQLINIKNNSNESVILETFGKEILKFNNKNITTNINEEENITTFSLINSDPIIKIINIPPKTELNLGPFICRQLLIPRPECQFELRSDKDKIRLNLFNLRKKYLKTSTLSISFRTSKPNGRLIELIDGGNGPLGTLDIIDGYLLFSNHIIHPSKLLADGNWHTIHLHLHSLSINIDNLGTLLSLIDNSDFIEPKWIDILINGEIAAIRILDENSNEGDKQWICNNNINNNLIQVYQSLPQQHIFSQPAACSPSIFEQNYCNCKGPNSALIQNGGFSRNSQQIAKCFLNPNNQQNISVHFSRYSDRLAFLFIPMQNNNFNLKTTISVLFKSEKEKGLILFGVFSTQQQKINNLLDNNNIGRIQVHFIGHKVYASQCLFLSDGNEKCFSCFIQMDKTFGFHDDWTRISLFYQLGNNFMSVNDLVCLLSPNSAAVDLSELYRINSKNVLFIGGTFYSKNNLLNKFILEKFRRDFQDNTKEKIPSLEGCISEILINGNNLNITQLINNQKEKILINNIKEDFNNIFSLKLGKCENCPKECKGAPCSRNNSLNNSSPICHCSKIYTLSDKENVGICLNNNNKLINNNLNNKVFPFQNNSIKIPIQTPSFLSSNGRPKIAKLNKIWILFKLPENKLNKQLFLRIGSLYLNIENYGHKILIESKDYGIFEEFLLNQQLDSRLHLFSIENTKINNFGVNTNDGNNLILIRFDNQIKYLQLDDFPIFILSSSTETFEIELFKNENEDIENENKFINFNKNGCIEELIFIYSTQNSNEDLFSSINDYYQVNYSNKFKQFINFCGVYDKNIFIGNTSSWGKLSKQQLIYNNNYININNNIEGYYSLSLISLLITILLIILMIISLFIYLFNLFKKYYFSKNNQQFINKNGKLKTKIIFEQEKQLLNENDLINKNEEIPLPPKNNKNEKIPNEQNNYKKQQKTNGLKNESSSPLMSIRPLESSPRKKLLINNGKEGNSTPPSPLRMTPLRPQQQNKIGNNNNNNQIVKNSSSSPPPLLPPSTFLVDQQSLLNNKNSLLTPSSPISELTYSSISPNSINSLKDIELMRPPIVKVIASINKRHHSPINNSIAAPIACKEEL